MTISPTESRLCPVYNKKDSPEDVMHRDSEKCAQENNKTANISKHWKEMKERCKRPKISYMLDGNRQVEHPLLHKPQMHQSN